MCINTPHNHPITSTAVHQLALPLTAATHGDASAEHSIYIHYSPVSCLDFSDWIYPLPPTGSSPRFPQSHGKAQCLHSAHEWIAVSVCVVVCLSCMLNGAGSVWQWYGFWDMCREHVHHDWMDLIGTYPKRKRKKGSKKAGSEVQSLFYTTFKTLTYMHFGW